jgi:hypothetical protein
MNKIELQLKIIHRYAWEKMPSDVTHYVVLFDPDEGYFVLTPVFNDNEDFLSYHEKELLNNIERYIKSDVYVNSHIRVLTNEYYDRPGSVIYGVRRGEYDRNAIIWNPRKMGQHIRQWWEKNR